MDVVLRSNSIFLEFYERNVRSNLTPWKLKTTTNLCFLFSPPGHLYSLKSFIQSRKYVLVKSVINCYDLNDDSVFCAMMTTSGHGNLYVITISWPIWILFSKYRKPSILIAALKKKTGNFYYSNQLLEGCLHEILFAYSTLPIWCFSSHIPS